MLLSFVCVQAQVLYDVLIQEDGLTYEVRLHPEQSWSNFTTTESARVSFKVPVSGFTISNVVNQHGIWALISSDMAADQDGEYDYYSFVLVNAGTDDIKYVEGQTELLFSFQNIGLCTGNVELLDIDDELSISNPNYGNELFVSLNNSSNVWSGNLDNDTDCSDGGNNFGCIDPTACNFDGNAIFDNGTCIYASDDCDNPCSNDIVAGCTDPDAENFESDANCDDGSCIIACTCEDFDVPVCGLDGVTYANGCEASCAGVLFTEGECSGPPLGQIIDLGCGVALEVIPGACGVCQSTMLIHWQDGMENGTNQWLFILYDNGDFEGDPYELNATLHAPQVFRQLCDGVYSLTVEGLNGEVDGCLGEAIIDLVCDPELIPIEEEEIEPEPVDTLGTSCGITLSLEYDCLATCPGSLTLSGPEELFDGMNQWLVEVFDGPEPGLDDPIKLNATLYPNETIDNLCDGMYSAIITGLNGDVEGCEQIISSILIENECVNPPCLDDVIICAPYAVCTEPGTAIIICPETCTGPNYNVIYANTTYTGTADTIANGCIRYTPLVGQEDAEMNETVELIVQDDENYCYRVEVTVEVGGCIPVCEQTSGSIEAMGADVCQGDPATAIVTVDPEIPEDFELVYLWVAQTGIILEISSQAEFLAEEEGLFWIHTLVYNSNDFELDEVYTLADLEAIVDDVYVCASLETEAPAVFTVENCIPPCLVEAGTLTSSEEAATTTACTGTVVSAIANTQAFVPEGFVQAFVLVNEGEIVATNAAPNFLPQEDALYSIHSVIYSQEQIDLNTVSTVTELLDLFAIPEICGAISMEESPMYDVSDDYCCYAEAGVLEFMEMDVCVGDTLEILTTEEPFIPEGFELVYLLLDGEEIVQASLTADFCLSIENTFNVQALVYDPSVLDLTSVVMVGELYDAFDEGELCGSISSSNDAPILNVIVCIPPCFAEAGFLQHSSEESSAVACTGTEISAEIDAIPNVPEGFELIYVLAMDSVIFGYNDQPVFSPTEDGIYQIYPMVFSPEQIDLTTIVEIGQLEFFFGMEEYCGDIGTTNVPSFEVSEEFCCDAQAGSLQHTLEENTTIACTGTEITAITNSSPLVSEGLSLLYILAIDDEIIAFNDTPSFSPDEDAIYTIYPMVYKDHQLDLSTVSTLSELESLFEEVDICGDIGTSDAPEFTVSQEYCCHAEAGFLMHSSEEDSDIACTGSEISAVTDASPIVPEGFELIYVLAMDSVIFGFNDEPVFSPTEDGIYMIYPLVFSPEEIDLSTIVETGQLEFFFGMEDYCGDLGTTNVPSFDVSQEYCCEVDAGTLFCSNGLSETFACTGTSISAITDAVPIVPEGHFLTYLLALEGEIVAIDIAPNFTPEGEGVYTVHPMIYDPTQVDLTAFADIAELEELFEDEQVCGDIGMMNPPTYFMSDDYCCFAEAGTLGASNSNAFPCTGSAISAVTIEAPSVPDGYFLTYVLAQEDAIIAIDIAPNFSPDVDGVYSIHPLVYSPLQIDLMTISSISELEDAFDDITVCGAIEISEVPTYTMSTDFCCESDPGTLISSLGESNSFVCTGTAISALTAETPSVPAGSFLTYILASGDEIIAVDIAPNFNPMVDGTYSIHPFVYDVDAIDLPSISSLSELEVLLNEPLVCGALGIEGVPTYELSDDYCCYADAGSFESVSVDVCLDENLEVIASQDPVIPEGFELAYILSDEGEIVDYSNGLTFEFSEESTLILQTLVYDPNLVDLSTLESLDELDELFDDGICGSISGEQEAPVINVGICNKRPIAVNDTVESFASSIEIYVLENDYDPDGDSIFICDDDQATNGTVFLADDHFVYVRNEGFEGDDKFRYVICDPDGLEDDADVIIQAKKICPPQVMEEGCIPPLTWQYFCPDWCIFEEGDEYDIVDISPMFDCGVNVTADNCIRYISIPGFTGDEEMFVTACNNEGICETISIRFTVTDCDGDGPTPASDNAIADNCDPIMIDVLANDSDPQGDDIFLCPDGVNDPNGGSASIVDNEILFVPNPGFNGVSVIYYDLCDSSGDSAGGVVFVNVNCPAELVIDDLEAKDETEELLLPALEITEVFPMPAISYLEVSMQEVPEERININVFDLSGKRVIVMEDVLLETDQIEIPVYHLFTGAYILQITCGEESCSRKFIKE